MIELVLILGAVVAGIGFIFHSNKKTYHKLAILREKINNAKNLNELKELEKELIHVDLYTPDMFAEGKELRNILERKMNEFK